MRIWNWIRSFLPWKRKPWPVGAMPVLVESPRQIASRPPVVSTQEATFVRGKSLLHHLDEYFRMLGLIRHTRIETFRAMMAAGGFVGVHNEAILTEKELDAVWRTARPPFGACFLDPGAIDRNDWVSAKGADDDAFHAPLFCFEKCAVDGSYALVRGTVYEVSAVFPVDGKAFWASCHVALSDDGRISPVKERVTTVQAIKRRRRNRRETQTVYHTSYRYPRAMYDCWNDRKARGKERAATIEQHIVEFATLALNAFSGMSIGLVARVEDPGTQTTGNFIVPMESVAKMFPPGMRDTNGRRIFHQVRVHQRGNGSFVKTHFRGERKFTFGRYRAEIFLPGLHRAASILDLGVDVYDGRRSRRGVEAGAALRQLMADGSI